MSVLSRELTPTGQGLEPTTSYRLSGVTRRALVAKNWLTMLTLYPVRGLTNRNVDPLQVHCSQESAHGGTESRRFADAHHAGPLPEGCAGPPFRGDPAHHRYTE